MKFKTNLILASLMAACSFVQAQKVTNGPELENDRDNRMNRMIDGDDDSYYTYRIRTKGKGTSYFVEKYDKSSLKPKFSKELPIEEDRYTKMENVLYSGDKVYLFIRQYNKDADKMTLFYRTVSSTGAVAPKLEEVCNVKSDHYEFVDFDIYQNPSKTKFLVKASFKENKDDEYKTNFILYDAKTMKQQFSKRIDQKLFTGESMVFSFFFGASFSTKGVDFIGLMLDDNDNVYYGYTYLDKTSTAKSSVYRLAVSSFKASENKPTITELPFDENYYVGNVKFSKSPNSEIVIGGFLKDVIERKGRDLVKVGIFSFTVDTEKNTIKSKTVKLFDDKILYSLESNPKRSKYFKYKLDYIFPIGNDVFYVGEQYREEQVTTYNSQTHTTSTRWEYEYMDVIVAKLNSKGEFEWVANTPLRIENTLPFPHVFKQYAAIHTSKGIYIINDEHPKNMERYSKPDFEPKDLKGMNGIHGTNCVCSSVSLTDGKIKHQLLFENDSYCFAPIQEKNPSYMPPAETEIFVPGKNNEIYIYTEDRGKDRFAKIYFE